MSGGRRRWVGTPRRPEPNSSPSSTSEKNEGRIFSLSPSDGELRRRRKRWTLKTASEGEEGGEKKGGDREVELEMDRSLSLS